MALGQVLRRALRATGFGDQPGHRRHLKIDNTLRPGRPQASALPPELKNVVRRTAICGGEIKNSFLGGTMNYLRNTRYLAGASALVIAIAAQAAVAQTTAPAQEQGPSASETQVEEVVVTGTLIRGVAPTGANVIGMNREAITATGATTTNDVLARIPQVTSGFLAAPTISPDGGNTSVRPNLRDLGRASGSTTLVLIDGHRVRPNGDTDPDSLPPGALDRVEIVPDGGSSVYGSDAIGGVINLITRRSFDGLEVAAHYGVADNYYNTDINLTAGKRWDTGSGYISYVFQKNDAIFGRDRDFMRQITGDGRFCPPGTIQVPNGTLYALPGRVAGTTGGCDNTDNVSYRPAAERHSIFGAFTQDLGDSVSFDVRGFYTQREYINTIDFNNAQPQTLQVNSQNPYFQSIGGETSQTVYTSFAGVVDGHASYRRDEFRVNPTLTARLGGGWQLRVSGAYDWNRNRQLGTTVDPTALATALAGTTTTTAINPYNLGASNPSVLASLLRDNFAGGEAKLYQGRAIADGVAFSLPGGDVRLAVGAEYLEEQGANSKNGQSLPGQSASLPLATPDASRNVRSIFGEVVAPIVGDANARPGVHALILSASGRYDRYSDFGGTFNPKLGVDYEPVDGFKVRANWGTSFNAPPLGLGAGIQAVGTLPTKFIAGQQAPYSVILAGFVPDIDPQTATTWSVGFEARPKAIAGLKLGATYYNIDLKDQIGLLALGGVSLTGEFSKYIQDNQTCAQVQAKYKAPEFVNFQIPLAATCSLSPQPLLTVIDLRQQNLGELKQKGLDFNVDYARPTSFGAITASLAGTYILARDTAIVEGAPFADDLRGAGMSRMFLVASVGAQVGDFTANAAFNHRQGYDLNPVLTTARFGTQSRVKSFNTVDLFLAYKLPVDWLNDDTSLTLNVSNLFDQDPPFYNGCIGTALCGFSNGATLGRLATFGLRTKF
ncbi:TonB-dependent receptor domain-containing protein [Caulobacter radicis]|nr:TonB-dependent receptor [Caulobacter radicis]